MRVVPLLSFFVLACFVVGCAPFTVPVTVKTSHGNALHGTAMATSKSGTFEVADGKGLTCSGTYDPLSYARTLEVALHCSDGRHGNANIQRDSTLANGIGQGKFSDGTEFEVEFGQYAAAK